MRFLPAGLRSCLIGTSLQTHITSVFALSKTSGMAGTLGSGGAYMIYGQNMRRRCSTISQWIGGGVEGPYMYPRTTRSARRSTTCGGLVVMAGRVGCISRYKRYEMVTPWTERGGRGSLWWKMPILSPAFSCAQLWTSCVPWTVLHGRSSVMSWSGRWLKELQDNMNAPVLLADVAKS